MVNVEGFLTVWCLEGVFVPLVVFLNAEKTYIFYLFLKYSVHAEDN